MEQAQKDFMQVMLDGAPERKQEIKTLWDTYNPKVIFENNGALTLNATSERIKIDFKMVDVFWLIGFSGWRAIETYFPNVIYAVLSNQRVAVILQQDTDLDEMERNYKERIAAVHTFIESRDVNTAPWPPDIPRPSSNRDALNDPQYQAAFDLTMSAVAFTLFHEFYHVMLDRDNRRPVARAEEELACDVWAAHELYGGECIIVDFGTAITIDIVNQRRQYIGGIIAPGPGISLWALSEKTALLPVIAIKKPKGILGKETKESMLAGIIYGFSSLCDGIVCKLKKRYCRNAKVIVTGGFSKLIGPYCETADKIDPDLTLKGLRLIAGDLNV